MKLGVLTVPLYSMTLEDALAYLHSKGVQAVELGAGGFPGKDHIDPDHYLDQPEEIKKLKALIAKYDIEICALSCHGNAIHPDKAVAQRFQSDFEKTVRLAEQLGVETVVTFSGCPGADPESKAPNWVTCAWPEDYAKILEYQWKEVLIPYWKEATAFAESHNVHKIALEMHPGFCVYNPYTLLKLRDAVGDVIGANLDPSHLIWQGIDPSEAVKVLGKSIYHVHAKDTYVDKANTAKFGVLDTRHYGDILNRSWIFRTVGYGTDTQTWKKFVSTLKMVGYDGVLSIEHEDALMSPTEGLEKAITFLQEVMMFEKQSEMWWA